MVSCFPGDVMAVTAHVLSALAGVAVLSVMTLPRLGGASNMTSEGTDFLLAFPATNVTGEQPWLLLAVAANKSGDISRSSLLVQEPSTNTSHPLKQVLAIELSADSVCTGDQADWACAVRVTSDSDVTLAGEYSGLAFLALPVASLGRSYTVVTHEPRNGESVFVVVTALHQDTWVCERGLQTSSQTLLQPLQSLVLSHHQDMSGLRVTSDKPISVISGANLLLGNGDATVAMAVPPDVVALGAHYWSLPTPGLGNNANEVYVVATTVNGTTVTFEGPTTLSIYLITEAGRFQTSLSAGELTSIQCSSPCLAFKMALPPLGQGTLADVCATPLVPTQQWLTSLTLASHGNANKVVVITQGNPPSTYLNGSLDASIAWTTVTQSAGQPSTYVTDMPPLTAVTLTSPDSSLFAAYLTGAGCRPAGMTLDPIYSQAEVSPCPYTPPAGSIQPSSTASASSTSQSTSQSTSSASSTSSSSQSTSSASSTQSSSASSASSAATLSPNTTTSTPSPSSTSPTTAAPQSPLGQGSGAAVTYSPASADVTTTPSDASAVTSRPAFLERCFCRRNQQCYLNRTGPGSLIMEQVLIQVAQTVFDLKVNKRNLSATKRRLSSAPDDRPSAQSVGSILGIGIIIAVIAVLILPDLVAIVAGSGRCAGSRPRRRRRKTTPSDGFLDTQDEIELLDQESEGRATTPFMPKGEDGSRVGSPSSQGRQSASMKTMQTLEEGQNSPGPATPSQEEERGDVGETVVVETLDETGETATPDPSDDAEEAAPKDQKSGETKESSDDVTIPNLLLVP